MQMFKELLVLWDWRRFGVANQKVLLELWDWRRLGGMQRHG